MFVFLFSPSFLYSYLTQAVVCELRWLERFYIMRLSYNIYPAPEMNLSLDGSIQRPFHSRFYPLASVCLSFVLISFVRSTGRNSWWILIKFGTLAYSTYVKDLRWTHVFFYLAWLLFLFNLQVQIFYGIWFTDLFWSNDEC